MIEKSVYCTIGIRGWRPKRDEVWTNETFLRADLKWKLFILRFENTFLLFLSSTRRNRSWEGFAKTPLSRQQLTESKIEIFHAVWQIWMSLMLTCGDDQNTACVCVRVCVKHVWSTRPPVPLLYVAAHDRNETRAAAVGDAGAIVCASVCVLRPSAWVSHRCWLKQLWCRIMRGDLFGYLGQAFWSVALPAG